MIKKVRDNYKLAKRTIVNQLLNEKVPCMVRRFELLKETDDIFYIKVEYLVIETGTIREELFEYER